MGGRAEYRQDLSDLLLALDDGEAMADGGSAAPARTGRRYLVTEGDAMDGAFRTLREVETPPGELARLLRDIFGNPFRPVTFSPQWRTDTVLALAGQMYESRDFGAMPILADALQDAGCDDEDILLHCRGPGPHVRGCWVVDLVLGKS